MLDLENSVREALTARVSHLTDERLAPDRAATMTRGRRRPWVLPVLAAAAVAAVAVGVTVAVGSGRPDHHAASREPALVGIEWQLESITQNGQAHPTPAGVDAVIRFDGNGQTSGTDGCNHFGGPVTIDGTAMRFGGLASTLIGCGGPRSDVENQFLGAIRHISGWAIAEGKLSLTGADGVAMIFHVRPSIYPTKDVTPLAQGRRAGGDYRFGYQRSGTSIWLNWEWRPRPGAAWGMSGLNGDTTETPTLEPICNRVEGRGAFVYGWAGSAATRVVYQGAQSIELTLFPIENSGQQAAFGGFVENARSRTPIVVYDATGTVLARSASLYCD